MLKIKNIHAKIEDKGILNGIDLEIKAGEIHAIMGPNGSGKSTLASVITGKEEYEVTDGQILFENEDLEEVSPEESCLLYTSPSPRDATLSRMPSSA